MAQLNQEHKKTALCLSGGGVRSAAFSIGVLQAVDGARSGSDFDCLSTVSGGGFAGSWYVTRHHVAEDRHSLWKNGKPDERNRRAREARYSRLGSYLDFGDDRGLNGPAEILLAYLGRLLVFWLFLVPFLWTILLVLAAAGLGAMQLLDSLDWRYAGLGAFVVVSLALQGRRSRFWLVVGTGLLAGAVASGYFLFKLPLEVASLLALPGAGIGAATLLGLLFRSSTMTQTRWLARVLGAARVVRIAAWIGVLLVLALFAWLLVVSLPLFSWYYDLFPHFTLAGVDARPLLLAEPLVIAAGLLGLMPSSWVSMATYYRDRIRHGFKERQQPRKLIHLINTAKNEGATYRNWDERNASSFALEFDFREDKSPEPGDDYWDAIATSAAVAGPRMGSYTARPIGLLLLLLNVRLGRTYGRNRRVSYEPLIAAAWRALMGLDVRAGKMELSDGGHFENLGLYEAIKRRYRRILVVDGSCDPDYQFSDLANAVRKIRNDFGVHIEFDGLRWSKDGEVLPSPTGKQRQRVYGGSVRYPGSRSDDPDELGQIVYLKAALVGDEPADVAGYADLHPKFPHESTTDQWFSESQFESYRRLGEYTVEKALRDFRDAKAVWLATQAIGQAPDKVHAADIVERLREAGITARRPDLRLTLAGVMLWRLKADQTPEREFLMVQSSGGGSWVLPKGHIERGESAQDCALRELPEETGLPLKCGGKPTLGCASVVIADRFKRRYKTEHCLYEVREWLSKTTNHRGPEGRLTIWVTANDYKQAWNDREKAKDPAGKAAPVRNQWSNNTVKRLGQAREFYGELLWLFDEANRELDKILRRQAGTSKNRRSTEIDTHT